MKIISIISQKGGVGKTTLALNLASILNTKKRTVLSDLDIKQRSACKWFEKAKTNFDNDLVIPMTLSDNPKEVAVKLKSDILSLNVDIVILDCPPQLEYPASIASLISDMVLIPVSPDFFEMEATKTTYELLLRSRSLKNGNLIIIFIPNKIKPGTKFSRSIKKLLEKYEENVSSNIYDRIIIKNAFLNKCTIDKYIPKKHYEKIARDKSLSEFKNISNQIIKRLKP